MRESSISCSCDVRCFFGCGKALDDLNDARHWQGKRHVFASSPSHCVCVSFSVKCVAGDDMPGLGPDGSPGPRAEVKIRPDVGTLEPGACFDMGHVFLHRLNWRELSWVLAT